MIHKNNAEFCEKCKDYGINNEGEWCDCEKGLHYNFLWFNNRLSESEKSKRIIDQLKRIG